jgi:hypothetical protein
MEERTHPVSYALTVARTIWELSNDAINEGRLPETMTTSMVRTAEQAALSLGLFAMSRQHMLPGPVINAIESAKIDLETLMQLADLIPSCHPTPKNATHIALAIRDTAEQAAHHLKQAEDALP